MMWVGVSMFGLLFAGLFYASAMAAGFWRAVVIWGLAVVAAAWCALAAWLVER